MSDLVVEVSIDASGAESGANEARRAIRSVADVDFSALQAKLNAVGEMMQSFGSRVRNLGFGLTASITAPIAGLALLGVQFNATKEQALTAFGVLLKSPEKAKQLYADLAQFAAATPFEMPGLANASKSLLAFGVEQEKLLPTLQSVGDIASGTGVPLGELAELYGKAKVQGRLFGEDINQLTGRGIPITKELAKQFGVSESKIKDLVSAGKVGFPELEKAFQAMTGEGGQFFGMMDAQSKTFSGRMSTLADTANTTLGKITEPLFNAANEALPSVISVVERVSAFFQNLSPEMQLAVSVFLAFLAALGPVLIVVGTVIAAVGGLITSIAGATAAVGGFAALVTIAGAVLIGLPVLFAQIAIGVAVFGAAAYLAYQLWSENFGGIRDYTTQIISEISSFIQSGLTTIVSFWDQNGAQILASGQNAFNSLKAFLLPIITEIVAFARENFQILVDFARTAFPQIQQFVAVPMQIVQSIVENVLSLIVSLWQRNAQNILEIVQGVWNVVKTIVQTGLKIISNTIVFALAVINGDWVTAWQAMRNIVVAAFTGIYGIVRGAGQIIFGLIKSSITLLVTLAEYGLKIAYDIGSNIVQGLINGITSRAGAVYSAATGLMTNVLGIFRDVPKVQSPARETIKIGEFVSEGLAVGITNKKEDVKKAAKKVADETLKQFNDAKNAFNLLAGSSSKRIERIGDTNDFSDATGKLQEIIKLRRELEINENISLPRLLPDINAELKNLKDAQQGIADAKSLLDELNKSIQNFGVEENNVKRVNDLLGDPARNVLIDQATAAQLRLNASILDGKNAAEKFKVAKGSLVNSGATQTLD